MGLTFKLGTAPQVTTNYIPKSNSNSFSNSLIFDNGTAIAIGNGLSSATPQLGLIEATDGSGTNIAGAELRLQGGQGTGTGAGGALTFYTSAAGSSGSSTNSALERMRIASTGQVGIGTNSPNDLLEVRGGFIRLSATSGNGPQFNLYSNGQTNSHVTLAQGFALATDNIGYLYNRANADFVFGTNNTERMRITSGGELLINATTNGAPNLGYQLGVRGTNANSLISIALANQTLSTQGLYFGLDGAVGYIHMIDNKPWIFSTNNIERMRITSAGNVGIGTSSPLSLLQLTGNNATVYDPSVDSGQDDGGVTLTIRNNDTSTVGSFSQIDMMVSGDSGRAIGRIVTIRTASATSDMAFVTENGNTKSEKMRITSNGVLRFGIPFNNYQLDTSTPIAIASGGTIPFETFSGLIIINNMSNGVCAMWLCGAGATSLIGQGGGGATGTLSYSVGINGYVWTAPATANYGVFAVRTRANA